MSSNILIVGEGMLELSGAVSALRLGYGGDTLNTAVHLSRLGNRVTFLSALGEDKLSADLRTEWSREGIDLSLTFTHSTRAPGLYAISTDSAGERSFAYWRGESAARCVFELGQAEKIAAAAVQTDLLLFSLISVAILPPTGRDRLFALCARVRANGGLVAFDGNYRDRLWDSRDEAIGARDRSIAACDIGLPTLEDEVAMGANDDARSVAEHWRRLGCSEPVVKLGADGCRIDNVVIAPPRRLAPVDTSGAGDAFNAGYIHARLSGEPPEAAALAGHRLAGWVLLQPGAIPPRTQAAPY